MSVKASRLILLSPFLLGAVVSDCAHAEPMAPPTRPVADIYCDDLKQVAALVMARDKFAAIAGKPRDGNFRSTSLALTGWSDCFLYGQRTYTCDSSAFRGTEEAETAQAEIARDIKTCLGDGWVENSDRSSSRYVVLQNTLAPASLTLSTNENNQRNFVVRLTLFARANGVDR